jgi:Fe-S oxidoreductase
MSEVLNVPTMAEMMAQGKQPEVLFWVGCAGSFDDRAKKITKAFVRILNRANVEFAVLGTEESCTGDPAKRAGNEFLFQMQAMMNIEVLNAYEAKKIVTACPHCFNKHTPEKLKSLTERQKQVILAKIQGLEHIGAKPRSKVIKEKI